MADALDRAAAHARAYVDSAGTRPVPPRVDADEIRARLGGPLPADGHRPGRGDRPARAAGDDGLMAIASGRFFGWVMGGTLPAALAADWLVSGLGPERRAPLRDAGRRRRRGGRRRVAARPARPAGRFGRRVRHRRDDGELHRPRRRTDTRARRRSAGTSRSDGLTGAPRVHVLVGAERHDTVDLALRYLGLGAPVAPSPPTSRAGSVRDALSAALAAMPAGAPLDRLPAGRQPALGRLRPVRRGDRRSPTRAAPGCTSTAPSGCGPPRRRRWPARRRVSSAPTRGRPTRTRRSTCRTTAGSRSSRDPVALRTAMGVHANYLIARRTRPGDPLERVPELSRRARGIPVWAALRSLGRSGVADAGRRARRARPGARRRASRTVPGARC